MSLNSKVTKRISAELIEFADSVNPSESYIKAGRSLVEAVSLCINLLSLPQFHLYLIEIF